MSARRNRSHDSSSATTTTPTETLIVWNGSRSDPTPSSGVARAISDSPEENHGLAVGRVEPNDSTTSASTPTAPAPSGDEANTEPRNVTDIGTSTARSSSSATWNHATGSVGPYSSVA